MKDGRKIAGLIAALLIILTLLSSCAAQPESRLMVNFFCAGDADAILLYTENSAVLIDCGEKGFGKEICAYLEENGIEELNYLIISHFDKDHVGGAAKVIKTVPIGTVLQNNRTEDSSAYEKYIDALADNDIEPVTVEKEYSFTLDGAEYTVYPPEEKKYGEDDDNNSSLIVSVKYGKKSLLFMGDATQERIDEFLQSGAAENCDLIKMPHHGRWEENLGKLLSATEPEYAVICCSGGNPPDDETIGDITASGSRIYTTAEENLLFTCDGKKIYAP